MSFLHGVETLEIVTGSRPITAVKSAVIGIVGIAPVGPVNTPVLVNNDVDAAQFGKGLPGFTIPMALAHILAQGVGTIVVVNVFDSTANTVQVTDESKTVTNGALKLSAAPIGAVTIKNSDNSPATIVKGTDYSLDEFGNFKALPGGSIVNGTVYKFTFKKLDGSTVTNSQIIGATDGSGNKTGFKALDLAYNLFGMKPKILIAPGYSSVTAIATEMIAAAARLKAICLLDAAYAKTVSGAITDRGTGSAANFNTSSDRAVLLYPYLKAYDEASNSNIDFPYSQFMAGVIAATDNQLGYWYSPSNKEIKGIVGVERNLSANISDPASDVNVLNEKGITTVFNSYGTGFRTWGNRSAAYPAATTPNNFIAIRRTADVVHESMELAALQFIDRPITQALIDDVKESGNAFMRILVSRGALIEGSEVKYLSADNTPEQLAAGQVTFTLNFLPPPPAERITFKSILDIQLLKSLK